MQIARARALAQNVMGALSTPIRPSARTRRKKRRRTIRAEALPPVGGLGDILDVVKPVAEKWGREVEPWQPWGGRKGVPAGYREYDNVYIQNGRVWAPYADGTRRMLGYTPTEAKKKYKTKRRRKRLTKRDMYILSVIKETGQGGLLGMML